jgi:hypothetical protein
LAEARQGLHGDGGTAQAAMPKQGVADGTGTVARQGQQTMAQSTKRYGGHSPYGGPIWISSVEKDFPPENSLAPL